MKGKKEKESNIKMEVKKNPQSNNITLNIEEPQTQPEKDIPLTPVAIKRGRKKKYETDEERKEAIKIQKREYAKRKKMIGNGGIYEYGKAIIFGRKDYQPKIRKILQQEGKNIIEGIELRRTPLTFLLNTALNAISLGEFEKNKPFDKLYHLSMVCKLNDGKKLLIEKNEVINMVLNPTIESNTETMELPISKNIAVNELLDNTKNRMGDQFFPYDANSNNCQHFIISILKANNLNTPEAEKFVFQDLKTLFKRLPFFTKPIIDKAIDWGTKINVISQGAGVYDSSSGSESENEDSYVVQSVIFDKSKYDIKSAKKWLKENKYKFPKVDEERNTLRFRQKDPNKVKKEGFTEYHNKKLGKSGITLVIVYKQKEKVMEGKGQILCCKKKENKVEPETIPDKKAETIPDKKELERLRKLDKSHPDVIKHLLRQYQNSITPFGKERLKQIREKEKVMEGEGQLLCCKKKKNKVEPAEIQPIIPQPIIPQPTRDYEKFSIDKLKDELASIEYQQAIIRQIKEKTRSQKTTFFENGNKIAELNRLIREKETKNGKGITFFGRDITKGEGIKNENKILKEIKTLENNISNNYIMPKFVKGSKEAKEHMARIRNMKGKGLKEDAEGAYNKAREYLGFGLKEDAEGAYNKVRDYLGFGVHNPPSRSYGAPAMMGYGIHHHHYHIVGGGDWDWLDPNKNGVAKAFDPNQNGVAQSVNNTTNSIKSSFEDGGEANKFFTRTLPSTLIHQGIPAVSGALGGLAGEALFPEGGFVSGIIGNQIGKQLGNVGADELGRATGYGFKKGSKEAKEHMAKIRAMRKKK